ncbi:MAG TPA: hypothetical protein VM146_02275 [Steroidobacteraceae bacterium]|nr:hypothetical protein [Steroidobacteraceae bacterium]
MPKTIVATLLATTLLLTSTACSPEDAARHPEQGTYKRPKIWPKPTEPEPASPIYHDVAEKVPSEEEIARDIGDHNAQLEAAVEGVLKGGDMLERETVFVYVLPELLQVEPQRLIDLHARLEPGEARTTLRNEIAQLWASKDPPAAAQWIKSLGEKEQHAAAVTAVTTIAAWDPRTATALAAEFDVARDDGIRKLLKSVGPDAAGREAATN